MSALSTVTAAALVNAGLTYRQIDQATSNGWLRPMNGHNPGTGQVRLYPRSELRIARLVVTLTDAGFKPDAAYRIARNPAEGAATLRRLAEVVAGVAT